MPNAMTNAARARKYVSQCASLAPCFIADEDFVTPGLGFTLDNYRLLKTFLNTTPIQSLFTDTWETD